MKLVISATAQIQISDFIDYYNYRNQTDVYSATFLAALTKVFEQLIMYPTLGRATTKITATCYYGIQEFSGLLFISGKANNHCFHNSHRPKHSTLYLMHFIYRNGMQ